jgi:hypothetical protein
VRRKLRDQSFAQPGIERGESFVGIDQQDAIARPIWQRPAGVIPFLTKRTPQGIEETRRGRFDIAPVEPYDRPATLRRDARVLAQQGRLADTARAVEVEDSEWWLGREQGW